MVAASEIDDRFTDIDYNAVRLAEGAMKAAAGLMPNFDSLVAPGIQHEVAAAAVVLSRSDLPGLKGASDKELLSGTGQAGEMLLIAAARLAEGIPDDDAPIVRRGEMARRMIADVAVQTGVQASPQALPGRMEESMAQVEGLMEAQRRRDIASGGVISRRLGDLVDFDMPVFKPVDAKFIERAYGFRERGETTGDALVDAAILAHGRVVETKPFPEPVNLLGIETTDPRSLLACARLLQDVSEGRIFDGAHDAAVRIEADRRVMFEGARAMGFVRGGGTREDRIQSIGHYAILDQERQGEVLNLVERSVHVSPLVALQLGAAVRDLDGPGVDRQRSAAMASAHLANDLARTPS